MTGGAHDTNGPKNGIACRTPAAADVRTASGRPSSRFVRERDQEVDDAHERLAAQEAAERARDARLSRRASSAYAGRDEPEQEGQDLVAVDDHVDRQEEHDQQRAERRRGSRPRSAGAARPAAPAISSRLPRTRLGLGHEVDLVEPERRRATACHGARIAGRFVADVRDRGDELVDRGRQRRRGDDDDQRARSRRPAV